MPPPGRFHLDWRTPLRLLRYLWAGSSWIRPGLAYWWWCRVASAVPALRKVAFRRFGDEPVAAAQYIPQRALFSQIERHPGTLVRKLAARVLRRYEGDLIVEREDLDWLRAR